jgi:hypothetical protein
MAVELSERSPDWKRFQSRERLPTASALFCSEDGTPNRRMATIIRKEGSFFMQKFRTHPV